MNSLSGEEYATSGFEATETVTIPAGPLTQFSFNMDSYLRGLGLPVQLDNGVIMNVRDIDICKFGEPLTKNTAKLLKQFDIKMGYFKCSASVEAAEVAQDSVGPYWQTVGVFDQIGSEKISIKIGNTRV